MAKSHRLIAATLLLAAFSARVFAATPLTHLVDDGAPIVISFHDVPELVKNWKESPWVKTWSDPQMKKFAAPLRAQMKVDEWDEVCKRETGYTASELMSMATGDALIALTGFDFGPAVSSDPDVPLLIAVELGENVAKVEKLMAAAGEKEKNLIKSSEEFSGVVVHIRRQSPPDEEDEEDDSDKKSGAEQIAWAFVDGVGLMSPSKERVFAAIDALKNGGVPNAFGQSERFLRLKDRTGDAHVTLLANMKTIYPALKRALEARNTNENEAQSTGFDFGALLDALGFNALEEIATSLTVGENDSELSGHVRYSERRGLIKLLAYRDGPPPQPDFVSAKWMTIATGNFSIREAYTALEEILENFSPAISGLVQGQIKALNQQLGIDLKRDLIGSLGDEIVSAYANRPGVAAEAWTPLDELDQFLSVSLENPAAFTSAIEGLKRLMGPQAEQLIQKKTYLDQTIYTFNTPQADGAAQARGVSYTIAHNHLFLAIGSPAPIESALQTLKNNQSSIWKLPEVKQALAEVPANACAFQYQNLRLFIGSMIETAATRASAMANTADATDGAENPEEAETTPAQSGPFDPAAKPDSSMLARYWSYASSYSWQDSNGLYFKSKIVHPR